MGRNNVTSLKTALKNVRKTPDLTLKGGTQALYNPIELSGRVLMQLFSPAT